jgi:hypothetical protein
VAKGKQAKKKPVVVESEESYMDDGYDEYMESGKFNSVP